MDAYEAVVRKRDQRAFLPTPLPDESLRRILQAGRMTGSSKNREPNRFVVVRDATRRASLAGLSPFGRWLADAPVVIVLAQVERHLTARERELNELMTRAAQGPIGKIVGEVSYGTELMQARGQLKQLSQVAAEKNCAAQSKWLSGRALW